MLSIIIPYYNTLKETKELLDVLVPQLNENVEVILIDDGCNEKELDQYKEINIIHLPMNSGTASIPRNVGLEIAKGDYITFIDSDDMITENYISLIQRKMLKNVDIIYLSWKSHTYSRIMGTPSKWNCSVWCRVFKRTLIGDVRFREDLITAEDWEFVRSLKPQNYASVKEYVYFYNNNRKGSLTRR